LLAKHKVPEGARLIDVGCGNGLYADMFAQQGLRVTAVDLSDAAIDYAKRVRTGRVDWIAADALTLPFENEFDYGFCHFFTLFNSADLPHDVVRGGRDGAPHTLPRSVCVSQIHHAPVVRRRLPGGVQLAPRPHRGRGA
jgi:SAM-dependent methyltransferase